MKPVIKIAYCPKCGWMLRAAYMAQELLVTFTSEIKGVLLEPAATGGTFQVLVDEQIIFDRNEQKRFPETKELKQRIRDIVCPEKSLGHSDKKISSDGIDSLS